MDRSDPQSGLVQVTFGGTTNTDSADFSFTFRAFPHLNNIVNVEMIIVKHRDDKSYTYSFQLVPITVGTMQARIEKLLGSSSIC